MQRTHNHQGGDGLATPLDTALSAIRPGLVHVLVLSLPINVLALTGALFMTQVFDRVLSTRSITTLVALTVLMGLLLAVWVQLDLYRASILRRLGMTVAEGLNASIYEAVYKNVLQSRRLDRLRAFSDLEAVRRFSTGTSVASLADLPWLPVYIIICYWLHPWLGHFTLASLALVVVLAILNDVLGQARAKRATELSAQSGRIMSMAVRDAETMQALGMISKFRDRWLAANEQSVAWDLAARHVSKAVLLSGKFLRSFASFGATGLCAYLVMRKETTGGAMFASMFIVGGALGIVQNAVSQWHSFVEARHAHRRVQDLFQGIAAEPNRVSLPEPKGQLEVQGLSVAVPGSNRFILHNVNLKLPAGSVLAIVGPSGAGKSTLVRALVGVWAPTMGTVRLDGAELQHWDPDKLGARLGYLPQNVELFDGTVAENIARFGAVDDEAVLDAARLAGVDEVIQELPDAYATIIGDSGSALSGGQRQRIGLARALYGNPALIVLDEPNSNLDVPGESALADAVRALKTQEKTCIIISHKVNILALADYVLVLQDGTVSRFDTRQAILPEMTGPRPVEPAQMQPSAVAS